MPAKTRARHLKDRTRYYYWEVRAYVEGWVLTLIRRGPRPVWARITRQPFYHHAHFGFSRIALGSPGGPDVLASLTPRGPREPDPSVISPVRVKEFLLEVYPAWVPDPYFTADLASEEEHGSLNGDSFEYDCFRHDVWTDLAGVLCHIGAKGDISFRARNIHRSPCQDAPALESAPLFDVVDVVRPFYFAMAAIASGAYDRLIGVQDRTQRRHRWDLYVGERIAFPTPLAGPDPIAFPGRIPASVPFNGPRPDPSEPHFWGRGFSRSNCRPERLVKAVLGDLLPHWGYENDPVVVSEVVNSLPRHAIRSAHTIAARERSHWPDRGPFCDAVSTFSRTPNSLHTHLHWQCPPPPGRRTHPGG